MLYFHKYFYYFVCMSLSFFFLSCNKSEKEMASLYENKGPFKKAYMLYDEGNFEQSIDFFEKGLLVFPEASKEHLTLAVIYDDHLENKDKAAEHYQAYLNAFPDSEKAEFVRKWIKKARAEELEQAPIPVSLSEEDQQRFRKMDKEIRALSSDILDKETENKEFSETIKQLENEIKERGKRIEELTMTIKDVQKNNGVSSPIENGKRENQMIVQKKMAEYENKMQLYQKKITSLEGEFKKNIAEKDKIIKHCKTSIEHLRKRLSILEKVIRQGKDIDSLPNKKITVYRVKKGETLRVIAGYGFIYGDKDKWKIIYKANKRNIPNADVLTPGQVLIIPREK